MISIDMSADDRALSLMLGQFWPGICEGVMSI